MSEGIRARQRELTERELAEDEAGPSVEELRAERDQLRGILDEAEPFLSVPAPPHRTSRLVA